MTETQQPDAVTVGVWGTIIGTAIASLGGLFLGFRKQRQSERTDEVQRLILQLNKAEAHIDECNEKHLEAEKKVATICGRVELLEERVADCHEEREELQRRVATLETR